MTPLTMTNAKNMLRRLKQRSNNSYQANVCPLYKTDNHARNGILDLAILDKKYLNQIGCFKKTSSGNLTMELNPTSQKCKELFEDCPDLSSLDKLESISIGLQDIYSSSYDAFLESIDHSISLKELYINSVSRKKVPMHQRYFHNIIKLCKCTSSKIYLTDIELSSDQLKKLLEKGKHIETFEMIGCKITDFPKEFNLNDKLIYSIKKLSLRGALNSRCLRIFAAEVLRNSNFRESLKDITVSKNLQEVAEKCFEETNISIYADPCNK